MEPIRQAVERAGGSTVSEAERTAEAAGPAPHESKANGHDTGGPGTRAREWHLVSRKLDSKRIIGHDTADPRSKSFDMVRTQVLQSMDKAGWRFLAVTSPTAGCGTTLTAINLALSIGRQPERAVLLVDLNLQKPDVADCLGIKCDRALLNVMAGRATLQDVVIEARIANSRVLVLPSEWAVRSSSDVITSQRMTALLQEIKTSYPASTVIFDLPPVLPTDEVISILPHMDCVVLVIALHKTTAFELRACNRYLHRADVVRVIVNKITNGRAERYY